uniref:Putative cysteine proteinase n=1 Tax=Anopheles braziliensis TaxID=58242 RepID=A0A2M3Z104_9DIPT
MGRRSRSMAQQLLMLLSLAAFLLVTVVHSESVEVEAKEAIAGGTEDSDNQDDNHAHQLERRDTAPKKVNKIPKTGAAQQLTPEEYGNEAHQKRIREALKQMAQLADGNGNDRKVTVVSATQSVVSGISYNYRLTFADDEEKRVCLLNVWERAWLKDKDEAVKVKFECPAASEKKRAKRNVCAGCPAGLSAEELEQPEHQERINKILSFNGLTRDSDFKVLSASKQVVAGLKYTYSVQHNGKICELGSWERAWLEASQPEEAYKYSYSCSNAVSRRRRRSAIPGSVRALTDDELVNSEHVQRVDKILVANAGSVDSSKSRIVSGTVQTVQGKLYKYAVEFELDGGIPKVCKLSAWERPWLEKSNPTEAYHYTVRCPTEQQEHQHDRKRRHAKKVGSSNELTAEELKNPAHHARIKAGLVSYNTERSKNYTDFEILAGSTQQTVGSLYKYTFKVTTEPDVVCKISIWERVWLETQEYIVRCTGDELTETTEQQQPETRKRSVRSLKIDDEEYVRRQFEKFKLHHQREYASSLEHEMRYNIFRNNLYKIDQLNRHERGTGKYGVTKFADMTTAEYRAHTGLIVPKQHSNHIRNPIATVSSDRTSLPTSFDWRDHGAVTGVKNQGNCGSCWAFSAIGNIEGLHQIKTKKLEAYSEQELIDCDTVDNGCNGGYMDDAFKAIEKLGGLELEEEYPYQAKAQKTCHFNKTLSHVRVKGAVDMPKNETFIAQYLIENGPIAIGLNANAMQFYRGGISHPWHLLCSHKQIDHGVLIVGYGVKEYPLFNKTLPYWTIKNSWGPKWGEQGYYRIYRGDNSCGVSEMASSAILE